jgi:hypothetical protein
VKILIIPFYFLENPMALRKRTTQAREKNFRIAPDDNPVKKQV